MLILTQNIFYRFLQVRPILFEVSSKVILHSLSFLLPLDPDEHAPGKLGYCSPKQIKSGRRIRDAAQSPGSPYELKNPIDEIRFIGIGKLCASSGGPSATHIGKPGKGVCEIARIVGVSPVAGELK